MPDPRLGRSEAPAEAVKRAVSARGCPACREPDRDALWWSKAGFTSALCESHKEAARSQRRLRYALDQAYRNTFTLVRMRKP